MGQNGLLAGTTGVAVGDAGEGDVGVDVGADEVEEAAEGGEEGVAAGGEDGAFATGVAAQGLGHEGEYVEKSVQERSPKHRSHMIAYKPSKRTTTSLFGFRIQIVLSRLPRNDKIN